MNLRLLNWLIGVSLVVILSAGAIYCLYRSGVSHHGYGWSFVSWWDFPAVLCGLGAYFIVAIWWATLTTGAGSRWHVWVPLLFAFAAAALAVYSFWRRLQDRRDMFSPWDIPALVGAGIAYLIVQSWWVGGTRVVPQQELRCAKCGYDLRATPERCPECGTVATKAIREKA